MQFLDCLYHLICFADINKAHQSCLKMNLISKTQTQYKDNNKIKHAQQTKNPQYQERIK